MNTLGETTRGNNCLHNIAVLETSAIITSSFIAIQLYCRFSRDQQPKKIRFFTSLMNAMWYCFLVEKYSPITMQDISLRFSPHQPGLHLETMRQCLHHLKSSSGPVWLSVTHKCQLFVTSHMMIGKSTLSLGYGNSTSP